MRLQNEAKMMWGKPPYTIAENCAVDVRSVAAAREWYKEKLGLRDADNDREEDSGRTFVDLRISDDNTSFLFCGLLGTNSVVPINRVNGEVARTTNLDG